MASNRIILIDTSYYVFYRYYATFSWYRRSRELTDINVDTLMQDDVFMKMFDKKFEDNLVQWMKKWKVMGKNVVFAKDCYRESIWRMKLYPKYKANRDERLGTFNNQIFKHTYQDVLPALQQKYGFHVVEHEHAEADDIIAISKAYIRSNDATRDILIITNDNDLIQLRDDKTQLMNLAKKDICSRIAEDEGCYTLTKVLMGDKSDNIPAALKKCGRKTAAKLSADPLLLQKKLKDDIEFSSQFELNKRLIDFAYIPRDIIDLIENYLKTIQIL